MLLSLVVGNALPENIVHEIESRGLDFKPSDGYAAMLNDVGADPKILNALKKARVSDSAGQVGSRSSSELLNHLATAGKLLRNKKYEDAERELTDSLQSGEGLEAGFVMGEVVLRAAGNYRMAASVYGEILRRDPDFPQAHTKLSLALYRLGDAQGALREAKEELTKFPDNAEAHKNAGLALDLAQKYDASQAEYNEALRLKPDYAIVHYDLGLLLENRGDLEGAIREYRKAIALETDHDVDARYNLATVFERKKDYNGEIRELREAKRLDPKRIDVRMLLAQTLFLQQMYFEAAQEYREILALEPDSVMAHDGLGDTLQYISDLPGAEKEYRKSLELDPSDLHAVLDLGTALENQEKYDAALAEYQRGAKLYEDSPEAHRCIGRILVIKKDFAAAIPELKKAETLDAGNAQVHELYGKAMQATGQVAPSIDEFRQAVSLDPAKLEYQVELAGALETNGDWISAMNQYRKASLTHGSKDIFSGIARHDDFDPVRDYKAAQMRFERHLAAMKAAGKTAEAAKLELAVATSQKNTSVSEQLDAALQAGFEAMRAGQSNDIIQNYKKAVDLADKLQPHDQRLMIALRTLGQAKTALHQYDEARALFGRELKATEEISGPQSVDMADPLENLAQMEIQQKDYQAARDYVARAQALIAKNYGEDNEPYAKTLRVMAQTYAAQKDYASAEPKLVRAVSIEEKLGAQGGDALITLYQLCMLYDRVSQPENAAACNAKIVIMLEKLYGPNDPVLISTLQSEASELRSLGRTEEVEKIDQRIKTLQASATNQK